MTTITVAGLAPAIGAIIGGTVAMARHATRKRRWMRRVNATAPW